MGCVTLRSERPGRPAAAPATPREGEGAVDDCSSPDGALLRVALEVASRLTVEDHVPVPVEELTAGQLREDAVPPVLDRVRAEADELRLAVLGE